MRSRIGERTIEHLPNGLVRVYDRTSKLAGLYDPRTNSTEGSLPEWCIRSAIRQHAALMWLKGTTAR